MGNLNGDKDVLMTRHGPRCTGSTMTVSLLLLMTSSLFIFPRGTSALVLSHWDLEGANLTCRSTCTLPPGTRSPRLDQDADWRERNCMCDALCAQYGDCCLDAPFYVAAQQRRAAATFSCVELRQFGGVYMRSTCPPSWADADVRDLCEDESSYAEAEDPVRFVPVTSRASGITYRNAHCALCHGDLDGAEFWNPRVECVNILQQANISMDEAARVLVYSPENHSWGLNLTTYGFQRCQVDPFIPETLETLVRRCEAGIVHTCAVNWTNADIRVRCEAYTAHVFHASDGYRNPHCAICNNVPVQQLMCSRTVYRTMYHKEFVPGAFSVLFDLYGGGGNVVGQQQPCEGRAELYDPFFKRCRDVFCSGKNQDYADGKCVAVVPPPEDDGDEDHPETESTGTGNTTLPVLTATPPPTATTTTNDSFSTCPKFVLEPEDFEVVDNATVRVARYEREFPAGRYLLLPDGRLEICATSLGTTYVQKFGPHMGYVTFAGLGVSVVFLLLHLAAFAAIPDLRNLSGKNLASLCVSLLCGYCAFMAGQVVFHSASRASCTTAAVFTHYGFLSAFLWSLAMAFDVWRTLRLATSELRVSAGKQWRKFAVYSAVCWTTPLVFVMAALLTDAAPRDSVDDDFRPAFADFSCWFGHRKALLVFFAAPLAVVMACNVAFFASSARMIFATTANTRFSSSSGGAHRDFRLYVRLAIVMGLTWTVGLVAGYLDVEGLWYAFVALNTLQGLFVFLAFTCTDKVARAVTDAVRRHKVTPGCVNGVSVGGLSAHVRNGAPPSLSWSGSDSTRKSHMGGSDSRETSDTLY